MLSTWLRIFVVIILALALCNQGGVVSAALACDAPADLCCPSESGPAPESSAADGCCSQPECQCLSCINIVLHDSPLALTGFDAPGQFYHDTVSPLMGGVYRTIDYPPETA
mgnify:CR=1 FL=1